jgi:hypothetical protein
MMGLICFGWMQIPSSQVHGSTKESVATDQSQIPSGKKLEATGNWQPPFSFASSSMFLTFHYLLNTNLKVRIQLHIPHLQVAPSPLPMPHPSG